MTKSSPWGTVDYQEFLTPDRKIYQVGTPSHGGIKVYSSYNKLIPEAFRNENGWYEEDCEWAIVYYFLFKELEASAETILKAEKTLKNYFWQAYESHFGVIISLEDSPKKVDDTKEELLKNEYVIVSRRGESQGLYGSFIAFARKGGHHKLDERMKNGGVIEYKLKLPNYLLNCETVDEHIIKTYCIEKWNLEMILKPYGRKSQMAWHSIRTKIED